MKLSSCYRKAQLPPQGLSNAEPLPQKDPMMFTWQSGPPFAAMLRPLPTSSHSCDSQASSSNGSAYTPYPDTSTLERKREFYFAGLLLGEVCTHSGLPDFSPHGLRWIQQQTGEIPLFAHYPTRDDGPPNSMALSQPTDINLPPKKSVEAYFSMFCKTSVSLVFPCVDPVLFWQTIGLAYGELPGAWLQILSAKACVLSFVSLMILAFGKWDADLMDCSDYSAKVQILLPQLFGDVSMTTMQAICIQVCNFQ